MCNVFTCKLVYKQHNLEKNVNSDYFWEKELHGLLLSKLYLSVIF